MLEESLMQVKCPLCTFFTALPLGLLIQSIFGEIEKWNKEYKEIMKIHNTVAVGGHPNPT